MCFIVAFHFGERRIVLFSGVLVQNLVELFKETVGLKYTTLEFRPYGTSPQFPVERWNDPKSMNIDRLNGPRCAM
jgi:hypothetical protein